MRLRVRVRARIRVRVRVSSRIAPAASSLSVTTIVAAGSSSGSPCKRLRTICSPSCAKVRSSAAKATKSAMALSHRSRCALRWASASARWLSPPWPAALVAWAVLFSAPCAVARPASSCCCCLRCSPASSAVFLPGFFLRSASACASACFRASSASSLRLAASARASACSLARRSAAALSAARRSLPRLGLGLGLGVRGGVGFGYY